MGTRAPEMRLWLAVFAALCAPWRAQATGEDAWAQGNGVVSVNVRAPFNYSVSFTADGTGSPLVEFEGAIRIRNQGKWYSTPDGTLTPVQTSLAIWNGTDARMGPFSATSQTFSLGTPPASDPAINATIRYFRLYAAFSFELQLLSGINETQLPFPVHTDGIGTNWSRPLPLATEFPSLFVGAPAATDLRFLTPTNNMLTTNFWAGPLGAFEGGLEGGPLALLNINRPDAAPPVFVMAPTTQNKDIFLSQPNATGSMPRRVAAGVSGYVDSVPAGFIQRVVVVGRRGLASAFHGWGRTLRRAAGTERLTLDSDVYSRQVHYMTDNGAYYCFCNRYNYNKDPDDPTKRYDVPMYKTVSALQAYHAAIGLRVGMYHLDPFWHSHHTDGHCDGVTASKWTPSAFHWPRGLGAGSEFQSTQWQMLYMLLAGPTFATDLPGGNAYQTDWPMEVQDLDTVVSGWRCCGQNSQVPPNASHAFWNTVLGDAVDRHNLRAIVADTLQVWGTGFSSRLRVFGSQQTWLDGYLGPSGGNGPGGASAHNLPIRIDQATPSDHMASASMNWPAVVSARCGRDMDGGDSWKQMATTGGYFLASLGVRPVMDVVWTTAVQPDNTEHIDRRADTEHALVVAVLTAGPVGVGDMINGTNITRISRALRADGTILKPAHPAVLLDGAFTGSDGCLNAQVWSAPAAPARSVSAREDRRANSMAFPERADGGAPGSGGAWWYTVLATGLAAAKSPCQLTSSALWPRAPTKGPGFVVVGLAPDVCRNGSRAGECLVVLAPETPGLGLMGAPQGGDTGSVRSFSLLSLAPLLPGGWALLGEPDKYIAVSPQRFVTTGALDASGCNSNNASDMYGSGADTPAKDELSPASGGPGLSFGVLGEPGEIVRVAILAPGGGVGRGSLGDRTRAQNGTVIELLVRVGSAQHVLAGLGAARVECGPGSVCRQV